MVGAGRRPRCPRSRAPRSRVSSRGSRPGTGRRCRSAAARARARPSPPRPQRRDLRRLRHPTAGRTAEAPRRPSPCTIGRRDDGRRAAARPGTCHEKVDSLPLVAPGPRAGARARRPTSRTSRRTGSRSFAGPFPFLNGNGLPSRRPATAAAVPQRPRADLRAPRRVDGVGESDTGGVSDQDLPAITVLSTPPVRCLSSKTGAV